MTDWLQLAAGGVLLYLGAEWFVAGASALALSLRIPQLIVGLTVVAYGTSAPEVIVGIQAAAGGHGDVALGNVFGSNIANIGLILGIAALVRPPRVDGSLVRREVPVLVATAVVVPLLLLDGRVVTWEACALLAAAVGYTAWMVRAARSSVLVASARQDAVVEEDAAKTAGAPRSKSPAWSAVTGLVGLGVLLVGGHLFVDAAVQVARGIGVSDRVIGLTVVAVGTSLPELVTSLIAALRGHSDIAVGNVVGSNIFNVLLCLAAAAFAGRVGADLHAVRADLAVLLVMTLLLAVFIRAERVIARIEGGFLLLLYAAFTAWTVAVG